MREAIIKVPHFLASRLKMASSEMVGTILEENERAVHFKGIAHTRQTSVCMRCGREIADPKSQLAGYGPECSEHIGIPRDFTGDQLDQAREAIRRKTEIQLWLPRSKLEILGVHDAPTQEVPTVKQVNQVKGKINIFVEGKNIFVRAPFGLNDLFKSIAGYRWDSTKKVWKYPASPSIAETVLDYLRRTENDIEKDAMFDELLADAETRRGAQHLKEADEFPPVPCTKHQPWLHQARAFWYVAELWGGLPDAEDNEGM